MLVLQVEKGEAQTSWLGVGEALAGVPAERGLRIARLERDLDPVDGSSFGP